MWPYPNFLPLFRPPPQAFPSLSGDWGSREHARQVGTRQPPEKQTPALPISLSHSPRMSAPRCSRALSPLRRKGYNKTKRPCIPLTFDEPPSKIWRAVHPCVCVCFFNIVCCNESFV